MTISVAMKHKATLILLLFLSVQLIAQKNSILEEVQTVLTDSSDSDKDKLVKKMFTDLPSDTAKRQVTGFQQNFRSGYLSDDAFNYSEQKDSYSYWQLLKKRLDNLLRKLLGYAPDAPAPAFIEVLIGVLSGIVVLIVLFVVVRILIRHKGRWFFDKKNEELTLDIYDTENLIEKADFRQLIIEHEQKGDTRSCIRLYFLWTLKMLKNNKLINWLPDKTNSEYLSEISDEAMRNQFSYLSYLYEYVWYGEFTLENSDYVKAKSAFEKLLRKEVLNG